MHLSIDIIWDFGLFPGSNNISSRLELHMIILKIKTSVFPCDGTNMNTPAYFLQVFGREDHQYRVAFDEKITNTGS